jgi:HAD superfamily hydrolase (TIGR01458 family)
VAAVLLDIDGVLHVSGEAIPGAPEAVRALRDGGHRLRFVTNNTTRARAQLAGELRAIGFELEEGEIETTPLAAAKLLAGTRVLALTMSAVRADLESRLELVDGADAHAVLLGGADESEETGRVFAWQNLNRAFGALRGGARLVCLHKNRWWQTSAGPLLDAGAFVTGLEYASGVEAEVVGKPSRAYFEAALAELGAEPAETVMVGDDVESDVGGAKAVGLRGVLVRTGKYTDEALERAEPKPDAVLDSIRDLPEWLA